MKYLTLTGGLVVATRCRRWVGDALRKENFWLMGHRNDGNRGPKMEKNAAQEPSKSAGLQGVEKLTSEFSVTRTQKAQTDGDGEMDDYKADANTAVNKRNVATAAASGRPPQSSPERTMWRQSKVKQSQPLMVKEIIDEDDRRTTGWFRLALQLQVRFRLRIVRSLGF
ncbi:hypothetical protein Acr_00g0038400 [Actinidia rufa]|uniref:Uncharacterized protein n=1 Tax=Actinidia rufa TaxID=165716 RepID=A0A7J0DHB5_9ERIC|nr:hypothetical protein Acr_00g0038400 [Actinidia rufa]